MINFSVTNTATERINKAIANMKALPKALVAGMREFEAYEQKEEMSGRPGLRAPTGTLRRSWHVALTGEGIETVATLSNDAVAWYAIVHENGGIFNIPEHTRRIFKTFASHHLEGMKIKTKKFQLTTGETKVRAHTMNMPKRLHMNQNWETFGYQMVRDRVLAALRAL
jgi:hypothetical protein